MQKFFWAQLGIQNEEAANILQKANHEDVVMDRCIKIEWKECKNRTMVRKTQKTEKCQREMAQKEHMWVGNEVLNSF